MSLDMKERLSWRVEIFKSQNAQQHLSLLNKQWFHLEEERKKPAKAPSVFFSMTLVSLPHTVEYKFSRREEINHDQCWVVAL